MCDYTSHLSKNHELKQLDIECEEKVSTIREQLYRLLPKEQCYLIEQLEEALIINMGIASRVAFKEGLILGLTELNYLSEVGQEIVLI